MFDKLILLFLYKDCLRNFGDKLSQMEETEIMDYPKIWFLGPEAQKIQAVEGKPNNNGINHIFNYIHSSIINYGTIIS